MTAPTETETTIYDGRAYTVVVSEPAWLYAWQTTDLETGRSWLSIYRSVLVSEDETRDLIGHRELTNWSPQTDPAMMFGRSELATYAAPVAT